MGKARVLKLAAQDFPLGLAEGDFSTIGLIERTERAAIQAQATLTRVDGTSQRLIAVTAITAVGPVPERLWRVSHTGRQAGREERAIVEGGGSGHGVPSSCRCDGSSRRHL